MHAVVWAMARAKVGRIKGKKFGARIERIETGREREMEGLGEWIQTCQLFPSLLTPFRKELELFRKILR